MSHFTRRRLISLVVLVLPVIGSRVAPVEAHWDPCGHHWGGYVQGHEMQLGFFQRLVRPRYWHVQPIRFVLRYHSHGTWGHSHPRDVAHAQHVYSWGRSTTHASVFTGEPTPLKSGEWHKATLDKDEPTSDENSNETKDQNLDDAADGQPSQNQGNLPAAEAQLLVKVPSEARLFVNDKLTRTEGAKREFISRGLTAGQTYRYRIRAELTRADGLIVQNRTVFITAGQQLQVAFAAPRSVEPPKMQPATPRTNEIQVASYVQENRAKKEPSKIAKPDAIKSVVLKTVTTEFVLHVPAGAAINLAGNPLSPGGPVRVFRTTKLRPGQQWKDYKITVQIRRNGRTLVETRTLDVRAGDRQELRFAFE